MDMAQPEFYRSSIAGIAELNRPDRLWLQKLPKTICPLDRLGLLRVTGRDAEEFLAKLVSCKLEPQKRQPQLCSICNPKGRILACFTVFYRDDAIYLQMPNELIAPTIQRLRMYVLTAKVELYDVAGDLLGMGYIGSAPSEADGDDTVLRAPGHLPRYFVYESAERIQTAWQQALDAGYAPAAYDAWHYSTIACGIPNIYTSTIEKLTPQTVNLDLLGALSFSKGCYPGQEIIARTHYLGKLKRRCYLYSAKTDAIKIGDPIYHSDHNEACGLVVDCYVVDADYSLVLSGIQINALDTPRLYVKIQNNQNITLISEKMPYLVKETSHNPEEKS